MVDPIYPIQYPLPKLVPEFPEPKRTSPHTTSQWTSSPKVTRYSRCFIQSLGHFTHLVISNQPTDRRPEALPTLQRQDLSLRDPQHFATTDLSRATTQGRRRTKQGRYVYIRHSFIATDYIEIIDILSLYILDTWIHVCIFSCIHHGSSCCFACQIFTSTYLQVFDRSKMRCRGPPTDEIEAASRRQLWAPNGPTSRKRSCPESTSPWEQDSAQSKWWACRSHGRTSQ